MLPILRPQSGYKGLVVANRLNWLLLVAKECRLPPTYGPKYGLAVVVKAGAS